MERVTSTTVSLMGSQEGEGASREGLILLGVYFRWNKGSRR